MSEQNFGNPEQAITQQELNDLVTIADTLWILPYAEVHYPSDGTRYVNAVATLPELYRQDNIGFIKLYDATTVSFGPLVFEHEYNHIRMADYRKRAFAVVEEDGQLKLKVSDVISLDDSIEVWNTNDSALSGPGVMETIDENGKPKAELVESIGEAQFAQLSERDETILALTMHDASYEDYIEARKLFEQALSGDEHGKSPEDIAFEEEMRRYDASLVKYRFETVRLQKGRIVTALGQLFTFKHRR